MKKIILLLVILTMTFAISAQSNYSPCYTSNMSKGNTAFNQGKYSEAKTYYVKAKECIGGNHSEAQKKINACDAKIKAQKEAAEARRKAEENAANRARGYQEFKVNGVTFKMIYVEGGTFTMGCTWEREKDFFCPSDEEPSHAVTLSDFWIGETEVTQELWMAVMGSGPRYYRGWPEEWGQGNTYPAYFVSWEDCQEFIRKLNKLTNNTFRLPTEAEWEYAARGGNKSQNYKFAGSNNIDDVAWFWQNSGDSYLTGNHDWDIIKNNNCKSHPVKTKSPNTLGIYDMSGNVYEWCQDWYGEYNSSAQANPTGPSSGSYRVYRGGSWDILAWQCRISFRQYYTPDLINNWLGFRLALVHQ